MLETRKKKKKARILMYGRGTVETQPFAVHIWGQ